jgi:hypothetical protein
MRVELPQYLPVEWVPREKLDANDWNPNEMPDERLDGLKQSIEDNGWTQPIVIHAEEHYIIDGEQRWTVAAELDDPDLTPTGLSATHVPVFGVTVEEDHARLATVQHNRARGSISEFRAEEFIEELQELDVLETATDRITFNDEGLNELLEDFETTTDVELGHPTEPDVVDEEKDTEPPSDSTDDSDESTPDTPDMTEYPSQAARNAAETRLHSTVVTEAEYEMVMEALGKEHRGQALVNLLRYARANDMLS